MKQTITIYSLILALAALFIYISCYAAPKAFDKSYDNQATMIALHKLDNEGV